MVKQLPSQCKSIKTRKRLRLKIPPRNEELSTLYKFLERKYGMDLHATKKISQLVAIRNYETVTVLHKSF